MQHVVLDQWSRGTSAVHRWDPRLKLVSLVAFLISISLTRSMGGLLPHLALASFFVLASRLPLAALAARFLLFLPLPLMLAAMTWLAGDPDRAALVLAKSVLSGATVLVVAATTSLPRLLGALESLGLPRALVMTIQMIWRYLFVVAETGLRMAQAARCRSGPAPARSVLAQAGAGLMTALFARSQARAAGVQQAMAARGYSGSLHTLAPPAATPLDWSITACAAAASIAAVWP